MWLNELTSSSPEFHLISLEVGLVLHHFHKTLTMKSESGCHYHINVFYFVYNCCESLSSCSLLGGRRWFHQPLKRHAGRDRLQARFSQTSSSIRPTKYSKNSFSTEHMEEQTQTLQSHIIVTHLLTILGDFSFSSSLFYTLTEAGRWDLYFPEQTEHSAPCRPGGNTACQPTGGSTDTDTNTFIHWVYWDFTGP